MRALKLLERNNFADVYRASALEMRARINCSMVIPSFRGKFSPEYFEMAKPLIEKPEDMEDRDHFRRVLQDISLYLEFIREGDFFETLKLFVEDVRRQDPEIFHIQGTFSKESMEGASPIN